MRLFERILAARGLDKDSIAAFLNPDYKKLHDPFLLPDMDKAVSRLAVALKKQQKVIIYGDYDVDGITATALLIDAFQAFGFKKIEPIIPSRFEDGYGLTSDAISQIVAKKADLVVTVDCGSQSEKQIILAAKSGIDIIVTDHHNAADIQPPAVAVINPKRLDSKYPFADLSGVGVAFKLVQAMQVKLNKANLSAGQKLIDGQEKWLLDLVALGTVCDIVSLVDENRIFAYWGIKVLAKQRRLGLRALMSIARVNPNRLTARTLGFVLGPRMNAAGRLDTAKYALDLLVADNLVAAKNEANRLDEMNTSRRFEQDEIMQAADTQAAKYPNGSVLVLSSPGWSNGIVGVVASKILEKYHKPTFILQESGDETRGSARSFGDFNLADAIKFCKDTITSGGGHKLAAGVVMPTKNVSVFREKINEYYQKLGLSDQQQLLFCKEDTTAELSEINKDVYDQICQLEPFGSGNQQPILKTTGLVVKGVRKMGSDNQHIKLDLSDESGRVMQFVAFSAKKHFFVKVGDIVNVWYSLELNEWQGNSSVEGRMLHLEVATK